MLASHPYKLHLTTTIGFPFPFLMDPPQKRQFINAHTGGQSRPEQHSWFAVHGSGPERYSRPSNTSSLQSYYTSPQQSDISSQSYYSARESPSNSTTNSASTPSSDMSFPYSVTSINSRKSRKNVLYPRREHPPPVAAASEHSSISLDALTWQVRFLCTTLLPYAETRLVPAGKVLLQSLGVHGYFSKRVPVRTDEETRCCAELFIALAHEILLKDAVSAVELGGPCKVLHATFKDILSKSGAFSSPKTPKSNETGLKAPTTGALALWQFSSVLLTLFSILNTFEVLYQLVRSNMVATTDYAYDKGCIEYDQGQARHCQGRSSSSLLSHSPTGVIGIHRPNNGAIPQETGSKPRTDPGAIEQLGATRRTASPFDERNTSDSSVHGGTPDDFYD
ncbi:hypothetical protein EDB92DRAFT_1137310 [Lactarius akahatsu]|uniref:Uncharacterized protein n=1 Tax=Lactarius akahatsu TaxID=416441 RepID=A0AAD4LBY1_9AGAM|nr:hypothetical protein EDB92DRAFT_1137310 [Lactarius akahatsu]